MIEAVARGASDPQLSSIDVHVLTAARAQPEDLLSADGLILGTPENFGYMSGALKDFFDRSFYEVEGKLPPCPTLWSSTQATMDLAPSAPLNASPTATPLCKCRIPSSLMDHQNKRYLTKGAQNLAALSPRA